jgi:glycosyltransferase involved in cell wall biosynthesis
MHWLASTGMKYMKLIVQIPCYNEEKTLTQTFNDIPKTIEGFEQVEVLIIDDGSTDRTIEVAKSLGVDHIVINKQNMGLARSFRKGVEECLRQGADVIVNTDGDNQYAGWDIPKLTNPVLKGSADIVIGDRQTHLIPHFSKSKKIMQWFGSAVVRKLAGIWVPDTVSGFRAISRESAIKLNVLSSFSYTIEMVIQAGKRDMKIESVPVETNTKTRESRLFKSIPSFIGRQLTTIVRMYAMYQPLKVFFYLGSLLTVIGLIPIIRFLFYYFSNSGDGHLQSLVLGGVLVLMGFIAYLAGLLADLISFNRQLLEMSLEKIKRIELNNQSKQ